MYRYNLLLTRPVNLAKELQSLLFLLLRNSDRFNPSKQLSFIKHSRLLEKTSTAESHLVLYYAKKHSPQDSRAFRVLDTLHLADVPPERTCHLKLSPETQTFSKSHLRFYGSLNPNPRNKETHLIRFEKSFSFVLFLNEALQPGSCQGSKYIGDDFVKNTRPKFQESGTFDAFKSLVIRRTYYSPTSSWNQNCSIRINRKQEVTWFVPFGTFNDKYSLFEADFQLSFEDIEFSNHNRFVEVEITPSSVWFDVSYQLIGIY